jgi:tellurite resistance protein TerC
LNADGKELALMRRLWSRNPGQRRFRPRQRRPRGDDYFLPAIFELLPEQEDLGIFLSYVRNSPEHDAFTFFTTYLMTEILNAIREAAPVIISLIIIEGLLSVDNMLAIAALASQLPDDQRKKALRLGLAGAYSFRILALFFAGFIMANEWVKFIGAFYLIHLMTDHFCGMSSGTEESESGHAQKPHTFWATIAAILLMDLSLSVDNVITAVAMSPQLWVVVLGVCLGLLTLLLFASLSLKLVAKFPILEHTAFLLIGYVGMILLVEMTSEYFYHVHLHISPFQKFIGIGIIMGLSIWYDRSDLAKKLFKPFISLVRPLILGYGWVASGLIGILLFPLKALRKGS